MAIGNINPSTTGSERVRAGLAHDLAAAGGEERRLGEVARRQLQRVQRAVVTDSDVDDRRQPGPHHLDAAIEADVPSPGRRHRGTAPSSDVPTYTPPSGSRARRVGTMCGSDRSATRRDRPVGHRHRQDLTAVRIIDPQRPRVGDDERIATGIRIRVSRDRRHRVLPRPRRQVSDQLGAAVIGHPIHPARAGRRCHDRHHHHRHRCTGRRRGRRRPRHRAPHPSPSSTRPTR